MEENYKTPQTDGEASAKHEFVAPGVPIVRTSTPRPAPFPGPAKTELPLAPSVVAADFPVEAPDAPPLPEEALHADETLAESSALQPPRPTAHPVDSGQEMKIPAHEFIWLFEYALDMDPVRLNRPERLGGSAFAYGPAVLKGYQLVFEGLDPALGQVIASLRPASERPGAEVWGLLYRVPRRFTVGEVGEIALLDKVHHVGTFVQIEVQVHEPYRQREITCLTYVATEATRWQVSQLAPEKRVPELSYTNRLLQIVRRQKLPVSYVRMLEDLLSPAMPAAIPSPSVSLEQNTEPLSAITSDKAFRRCGSAYPSPVKHGEYNPLPWKAEPGPAETGKSYQPLGNTAIQPAEHGEQVIPSWQTDTLVRSQERRISAWSTPSASKTERWLGIFGVYVSLVLLGILLLAVLQGLNFWPDVFTNAFTPLGIPWYVLLYGLLGGCVSCLISLNRTFLNAPPIFTIFTWFARPLLGAVLGAFAYLLLNSGAVLLSAQSTQHFALCAAVSSLAGLCEGKLLLRKNLA